MSSVDRLLALRARHTRFTGIDFVQVEAPCDQTVLRVYFQTDVRALVPPLFGDLTAPLLPAHVQIRPTVEGLPEIQVEGIGWGEDEHSGRVYLQVNVKSPGDFARYRLRIVDPYEQTTPRRASRIDPYFNDVAFSFKAGCDDRLDCAEVPPPCEPDAPDGPIDYLARDFVSIRNALLDMAAQRFPSWGLPIEADVGMMVLELFAALGDEFSYIQDRFAREGFLETLTQRRSLRKKAQLVDYPMHDGRTASTWLLLTVDSAVSVHSGDRAFALSEDAPPVVFEVGLGLRDQTSYAVPNAYSLRPSWNREAMRPYAWDEGDTCLAAGTTELWLQGHVADPLLLGARYDAVRHHTLLPGADEVPGRSLWIGDHTPGDDAPSRGHRARVRAVELTDDPVLELPLTRIVLWPEDALPWSVPFENLTVSANLVPALAGETRDAFIQCLRPGRRDADDAQLLPCVEREGPLDRETCTRAPIYLFALPGTEANGLAFVGDDVRSAYPEVLVFRLDGDELATALATKPLSSLDAGERKALFEGDLWCFVRSMLDAGSSDPVFTLEDGSYRRIVAYRALGDEHIHRDYATQAGYTLRFGDGMFGLAPAAGDAFYVAYRLGTGTRANLPAHSVRALAAPGIARRMPPAVIAVTNPWAVTGGEEPESARDVKEFAPEAFKSDLRFAVREEDYATQAETLPWVQRAHGKFRWTGSWHAALTAADPRDADALSDPRRRELTRLLDDRRQAGREVIVKAPRFVDLDLDLTVCLSPGAYEGAVRAGITRALFARGARGRSKGFFHPDHFTFGTSLNRAALEAALLSVDGVEHVVSLDVRPRGRARPRPFRELDYAVPPDSVLRVANDPLHPEHGTVRVHVVGGA